MELLIEDATPELSEYLTDFCAHVCTELDMPEHPDMTFVDKTGATSFGSYRPADGSIIVATGGRHVADILRTLAHEIIHDAQHLNGEPDLPLDELEYEANAMAGMLMRDWNKLHPELYGANEAEPTHASEEGESQGAVFPDPTRPSGPIEMGEDIIIELSNKTLSNYKKQAGREVKVAKRDWYSWKNDANRKPAEPFPKTMLPTRQQGIETASKKLQARYALAEAKIKESDSDALKLLKLQNKALRAFPSSPRQQEIQKQIEMLRKKMKKEGTPQYHQTLKEDGWHGFRVSHLDLSEKPDFVKAINEDTLLELSTKTLSSYKRKANAHVRWLKVAKPVFDWKWKNATPGNPKTMQRHLQYADPNAVPKREQGIKTAENKLRKHYAPVKIGNPYRPLEGITEEGIVNSAGSGAIAGLGVGPQGEPGVHPKKKKTPILQPLARRKTFATLREEVKDPAAEARKKLATQKIPVDAKTLLARRKLVAQIDAKKKGNLP